MCKWFVAVFTGALGDNISQGHVRAAAQVEIGAAAAAGAAGGCSSSSKIFGNANKKRTYLPVNAVVRYL